MGIEEAAKAIRERNNFLVTAHVNLEGDSIGSQLAVALLLKSLGKKFTVLDSDKVPQHYMFLPDTDIMRHAVPAKALKFGAAIVLDCPNLERVGKIKGLVKSSGFVINIDHHVSNANFGDINWVEPDTSSVGEMIFRLFKKMDSPLSKKAALYLYIAILTDTGSFNYSNTSGATHEIVSELLGYGLEPGDISRDIYENKSVQDLKLLGRALSRIRVIDNGRIAHLTVERRLLKEIGAPPDATEDFINYARSIKGVEVAVFFREDLKKKNVFHVSLRSKGGVDVNKIASFFKGGGHKKASGCVLKGGFAKVRNRVLERVKEEIRA